MLHGASAAYTTGRGRAYRTRSKDRHAIASDYTIASRRERHNPYIGVCKAIAYIKANEPAPVVLFFFGSI